MHVSNAAFAAAGLGLWQLGRLDHGPLGTALRGELGTMFVGLGTLGLLIYGLLFVFGAPGVRRARRAWQAAPRWRRVATWIVLPVLMAGYAGGLAEQLADTGAWTASPAAAAPVIPLRPVATYPAATRQHFMNSCIVSGGTQSSCACAIDGIQAHYSLQDFVAFDARARAGEKMPDDLVRIVATCNAGLSSH